MKIQLLLLPDLLSTYNEKAGIAVRRVTSIRTVIDLMNSNSLTKTLLSEVDKLLRTYLTVPLTTSTAFSTLRRVKTYLRSTMTQARLSYCIFLHTHKDKTDLINVNEVATDFINANERRKLFFGKFNN